ncbi:MAG: VOC family protein [Chloroflexi bacterium]|nr:VOC family protein [Chloroflexota bacterium]
MDLKIDHIGIAVKDLVGVVNEFKKVFEQEDPGYYEVESQKVKAAIFKAGDVRLEFLSGTAPDSPISLHIEKRGQGIQHIAFKVENLEKAVEDLKSRGVRFIGEPSIGAEGKKVIFIHPSAFGMLVELCEESHC